MKNAPLRYRDNVSAAYAAAVLIAMVCVFFPLLAYRDYRSVFGSSPEAKLLLLAGLGSAAAFAVYVGPGERRWAAFSGLIGGLCGVGLFVLEPPMLTVLLKHVLPNSWPAAIALLGSIPGFLLVWVARRIRKNNTQGELP